MGKKSKLMHYFICMAIVVLMGFMPQIGQITSFGMLVLGTLVGIVYAWANGLDPLIAVVILIFYSLRGGVSFTSVVFPGVVGNASLWITFFCFAFVYGLRKSGLVEYLTTILMKIGLAGKGPYWLMFIICFTTYVACTVTQASSAVFVLMLAMIREYAKKMKLKKYSLWTFMTAMGISIAACFSLTTLPYNASVQLTLGVLTSFGVQTPSFLWLGIVSALGFFVSATAVVLITKYIMRPKIDISTFLQIDMKEKETVRFTRTMRNCVLAILFMAALLAIPMLCPAEWKFTSVINNVGTVGAFAAATIVLCFIKTEEGKPLFDFGSDMKANTDWSILMFLGGILYLGSLFTDESTGIMVAISGLFNMEGANYYLIAILLCVGCAIVTNVVNGLLAFMLFVPLIISILPGAGVEVQTLAIVGCFITCGFGFALPGGSFNGLVMHADKETFKFSHLCVGGFALSMLCSAITVLLVFLMKTLFYSGPAF